MVMLATMGVSAWGLAESIRVTNTTVSDFWELVGMAEDKVCVVGMEGGGGASGTCHVRVEYVCVHAHG